MKELLQGRWMGHPLHPALVHLPTGLWISALVFDLLSLFAGNVFVQLSFYAIALGLLVALLAIPAGLADWLDAKVNPSVKTMGLWHLSINGVVFVLLLVSLGLRFGDYRTAASVDVIPLVISFVSVLLLFVSGYLGGRMVYDQGASVASMSVKKWKRMAEQNSPVTQEK